MLNYLALLNSKANHRKVILADRGDEVVALVTSANPHDGSSAHGNVGILFSGAAVADLSHGRFGGLLLGSGHLDTPLGAMDPVMCLLAQGLSKSERC